MMVIDEATRFNLHIALLRAQDQVDTVARRRARWAQSMPSPAQKAWRRIYEWKREWLEYGENLKRWVNELEEVNKKLP